MKIRLHLILGLCLACILGTSAQAGIYTDDMSRCLVNSATVKDKTDLIKWIFGIMAAHPDVAAMSAIKDKQRDELTKTAGLLLQRLMTEDCRKQTADAIKYEGNVAIQSSFAVLGQVAMQELMTNPIVARSTSDIAKYIDENKFKGLLPDADDTTAKDKK
jgi:hypothetical protein